MFSAMYVSCMCDGAMHVRVHVNADDNVGALWCRAVGMRAQHSTRADRNGGARGWGGGQGLTCCSPS